MGTSRGALYAPRVSTRKVPKPSAFRRNPAGHRVWHRLSLLGALVHLVLGRALRDHLIRQKVPIIRELTLDSNLETDAVLERVGHDALGEAHRHLLARLSEHETI